MSEEKIGYDLNSAERLLGSSFRCECGRVHTIPVKRIVLEEDGCLRLPEVLEELSLPRSVCVVADDNTFEVMGREVVRLLSGEKYGVREVILRAAAGKTVKADRETADKLLDSLPSAPMLIAVGSGTINDLTKLAAHERGIAYAVVATAPSMNGYTSSIVALTVEGLKTTFEARPPVAVVGDLKVLVEAPMELVTAGLGDVVSKPVSTADWKLGELVNGEYFCSRPIELVEKFESCYMNDPRGIGLRHPEAIRALTEALLYSGISMVIAGSSSPASGGEHLISHTLDMRADLVGRDHDLHGRQVGVATIFSASLYERVMEEDIRSVDVEALSGEEPSGLERYWGRLAGVVQKEFSFKYRDPHVKRERMVVIQKKWDQIRTELRCFLRPWTQIRDALREAGGATRVGDIGLSLEQFREAVIHARQMRRRYTVLDLADDFGLLEKHLDDIVRETGLCGG